MKSYFQMEAIRANRKLAMETIGKSGLRPVSLIDTILTRSTHCQFTQSFHDAKHIPLLWCTSATKPCTPKVVRRLRDWLVAISIVLLLAHLIAGMNERQDGLQGMVRVTDGDSLTLNNERIRLWGIDAPELDQSCRRNGELYPCGETAKARLKSLIGSREVACNYLEKDKYGRVLATCRVGDVALNEAMVESGWAVAYGGYLTQELKARRDRLGLWEGTFDMPRAWRDGHHDALVRADRPMDWLGRIVAFLREKAAQVNSWLVQGGELNETL